MAPSDPPLSPETRAAQALGRVDPRTGAVVPGIEPATTFARDAGYEPRQRYIYARDGGPNAEHAEAVLASLDGAARSFVFSSGMAAFVALCETLRAGDRVAAPRVMYHGGLAWLRRIAERRELGLDLYDAAADGSIASAVGPDTRLLWVETPANPTWDVVDIAAAARSAQAVGAILAVDGTVAPPCTMRALELGADIAFHSGTKYLGGHSDLTAGVISLREDGPLAAELGQIRTLMGGVLQPFEAWLLVRGMRTLFLRYARSSASAMWLAEALEGHPAVERVLYPGLPAHPRHAVAARQMTGGFGGMLSVLVRGGFEAARKVACTTRLFLPATSLGGVESLIEHRRAVEGPDSEVPDNLLRLSVGIEDAADLERDLRQALDPIR